MTVLANGHSTGGGAPDRMLPAVITLSLLAHLGLFLPLLLPQDRREPTQPVEMPVEVVQMPAPNTPKPPPQTSQPPERKREEPKREEGKQDERKRAAAAKRPPPPAQREVAERMRDLLGSMPAIVLPSASSEGSEVASFKAQVLSKVGRAKKEGRHNGIPGIATVAFTLDDRGGLSRCEILRKSVDPALDAEALAMVQRGVPYPVPPPDADRSFVISLRFAALP